MDFQYHICMMKPRLHDLDLGGLWQPCSTELASIHTTNHVGLEKRVVCFSFSMHACGCFYSYEALILIDQRINDFFPLCLPSCDSSKNTLNTFDFSFWSPDEIMRLSVHSYTSYLDARWKFCSLLSHFLPAFQFFS